MNRLDQIDAQRYIPTSPATRDLGASVDTLKKIWPNIDFEKEFIEKERKNWNPRIVQIIAWGNKGPYETRRIMKKWLAEEGTHERFRDPYDIDSAARFQPSDAEISSALKRTGGNVAKAAAQFRS